MAILKIKDDTGNIIDIPAIRGKSAYECAKEAGYTGTEADFNKNLSEINNINEDISELQTNKANKATTLAGYGITDGATKSDLETLSKNVSVIPNYVVTEAESVLSRVLEVQGTRTFNMSFITDLHNNGGVSDPQITHACQGIGYIADRIKLNAFGCLGDHTESSGRDDWAECLKDILDCNSHKHKLKNADFLEVMGNHDFKSSRSPMTSKLISAFSTDVVWGSELGGYFHKDYEEYKLRIIGVNTSETGWISVSTDQYKWFINTLDLSSKSNASEWQILIISHVPLDFDTFTVFSYVLNAYVNGTSWTNGTYSCNYAGKNKAIIIGNAHGHIHNFLTETMYLGNPTISTEKINVWRFAMPEVTELYNNHYTGIWKHTTSYAKSANTAKDTSFTIGCFDLDNHEVNLICYGAGIDRKISYNNFENSGDSGDNGNSGNNGVIRDDITNLVPIAKDFDGEIIDGVGYKQGHYISTSNTDTILAEDTEFTAIGMMPITNGASRDIYVYGLHLSGTDHNIITMFDYSTSAGTYTDIAGVRLLCDGRSADFVASVTKLADNYFKITTTSLSSKCDYFAISGSTVEGLVPIITVDEEIISYDTPSTSYTNQIPLSINTDGTPFNNGQGYKTGYRLSLSGGGESAQEGTEVTGFIPVTKRSVIRIKDIAYEEDEVRGVVGYDENFTKLTSGNGVDIKHMFVTYGFDDGNGVRRSNKLDYYTHFNSDSLKYIRLCSTDINENSIITVDEEIIEDVTSSTPQYTNLYDVKTMANDTYLNKRINSSGGYTDATGYLSTPYIPYKINAGDTITIRTKGIQQLSGSVNYGRIIAYEVEGGTNITSTPVGAVSGANGWTIGEENDSVYTYQRTINENANYIRFTLYKGTDSITAEDVSDVIITINEEITDSPTGGAN